MNRRQLLLGTATALTLPRARSQGSSGVLVIGPAGVPRIDTATVMRLYTGRAIEAGHVAVTVVNLSAGHPLRQRFLAGYLKTDEEHYRAYWTVRRHVGKGAPPRELGSVAEVIDFVTRTPGAVGYVDAAAAGAGINVICRA
jgi:hypothetical protein